MAKCKITVLRRTINEDIVDKYLDDSFKNPTFGLCDHFADDEEFVVEDFDMPEGFCPWAWADIQRDVVAINLGGADFPWMKAKGTAMVCCTDGFRPVIFLIERVMDI
ncbi:MAG: TIGR04076 family protein [Clostridiales bacterium]|nr:TIGR04076 family protein [Clostridiales bacterium]